VTAYRSPDGFHRSNRLAFALAYSNRELLMRQKAGSIVQLRLNQRNGMAPDLRVAFHNVVMLLRRELGKAEQALAMRPSRCCNPAMRDWIRAPYAILGGDA